MRAMFVSAVMLARLSASAGLAAAPPPASWSEPVAPFRVVGNVYYVGTRGLAAYLIRTDAGAILLDGTMTGNERQIERSIAALGVPLTDVKLLLSSHEHWDHAGALAAIKRDTGAPLAAEGAEQAGLETGNAASDNDLHPRPFAPLRVDRELADGETVRLGGTAMTAVLTPGHTPGCTTWRMTAVESGRRLAVVFPCSITVAGNRLVGNRAYPGIVADYRRSFARLAAIRADIVLPAHPDVADVLEREQRRAAGDRGAFVDPNLLGRIVAAAKSAFESELARQAASAPAR